MGEELPPEVTKASIRERIWDHLEKNDLAQFPRPVKHRIPNFKGSAEASDKVATLDVFTKAQVIKINPDKPQEQARFLTLEAHKTLLVPTPRLRVGLFNKINPPEDDQSKEMLHKCATSQGVREHSKPVGLDATVSVDLVIVGSVAVSPKGYRIGKGEGFADLEYAMMKCMGAVTDDTIIVTTVHDDQVTDIPDELIGSHDITVDFIVTPTQVIRCPKQPKPAGIFWEKLTREKLRRIPILRKLRTKEREEGKDVRVKDDIEGPQEGKGDAEEDGDRGDDEEDREKENKEKPRRRFRPRYRRNVRGKREDGDRKDDKEDDGEKSGEAEGEERKERRERRGGGGGGNRGRRRPRRRRSEREGDEKGESGGDQSEGQEKSGDEDRSGGERSPRGGQRRNPRRPRVNHRPPTVYIGGIPRSLRVSEFKSKVKERGVAPLRVIWHGANRHAFLQFLQEQQAEDALNQLQELTIQDRPLKIEMSNRNRSQRNRESGGDSTHDREQDDVKEEAAE